MTEILGALIILGAVLLLIVRYIIHRRQRSEEEDEDLATSIEKLKKELQQSADTIIKRLGSHVTKLEGLLREADDRRVRLETRVADAQRLEWALRQRIEELERRLRDMGQPLSSAPVAVREGQSAPLPVTEARRTDGDEFAAVLHQSILREQERTSAAPVQQVYVQTPQPGSMVQEMQPPLVRRRAGMLQERVQPHYPQAHGTTTAMPVPPPAHPMERPAAEEQPVREDETIIKARALLRAGRTIEQVARETGVEIGALRLMKQMTQRD